MTHKAKRREEVHREKQDRECEGSELGGIAPMVTSVYTVGIQVGLGSLGWEVRVSGEK